MLLYLCYYRVHASNWYGYSETCPDYKVPHFSAWIIWLSVQIVQVSLHEFSSVLINRFHCIYFGAYQEFCSHTATCIFCESIVL